MITINFATTNPHKVKEGNSVGKKYGVSFRQVAEGYPEVRDEDVAVVAEEGARYVFDKIKETVIVEDTGLFIEILNGFPGSYSAFVFNKIGNEGILSLLKENERRKARFVSAIGYCDSSGVKIFRGEVEGFIVDGMRGEGGFGYDPIFQPHGYDKTFAQDYSLKNKISHRKRAFQLFCEWFRENR